MKLCVSDRFLNPLPESFTRLVVCIKDIARESNFQHSLSTYTLK